MQIMQYNNKPLCGNEYDIVSKVPSFMISGNIKQFSKAQQNFLFKNFKINAKGMCVFT